MIAPERNGAQLHALYEEIFLDTGICTADVDYINAHGTGTLANDGIEVDVLIRGFPHLPLINSTKSLIGHTLGASGAIEAVFTAKSLCEQTTHVCNNLSEPIADINFVTQVKPERIEVALSQSLAFGGHNSLLGMRRLVLE